MSAGEGLMKDSVKIVSLLRNSGKLQLKDIRAVAYLMTPVSLHVQNILQAMEAQPVALIEGILNVQKKILEMFILLLISVQLKQVWVQS